MWRVHSLLLISLLAICLAGCERQPAAADSPRWSTRELAQLRSLSLDTLPPPPPSPGNRVADDPAARAFGTLLFHDQRLSRDGRVACASCHQPALGFSDGRAQARGLADLPLNTPTLLGAAWSLWQFRDGRADSLWAQATQPLRDAREQGLDADTLLQVLQRHYREPYEALFGPLPSHLADENSGLRLFANVGKALEAFERQLKPARTRFDRHVANLGSAPAPDLLTRQEEAGLRLFVGKADCVRCHLGPLFSNQSFHNTGIGSRQNGKPDLGRDSGLALVLADPLNCQGRFHDSQPADCAHLRHVRRHAPEWLGAFKVPTLRGVGRTAPYMHDGRFATLEDVVRHYVQAPNRDGDYGHTELRPLLLTPAEQQALADFLKTL